MNLQARPLTLTERRAAARQRHAALKAEMDRQAGTVAVPTHPRRSVDRFVAVGSTEGALIFDAEPDRDRPG